MRFLTAKTRFHQQARTRADAHCFALELRDGTTVYRWTTHDKQIRLPGDVFGPDYERAPGIYIPHPGLRMSSIRYESALRGNTMSLDGAVVTDSAVGPTADQLRARKLDGAIVRHWIVSFREPSVCHRHDVYDVARVSPGDAEWNLALIGRPARRLAKRFGQVHRVQCNNQLGVDNGRDSHCNFDVARPAFAKSGTFSAVATGRQITGSGIETGLSVGDPIQLFGFTDPDLTDALTITALGTNSITVDRDIPDETGTGDETLIRVGYVDGLVSAVNGDSRREFTIQSSMLQVLQMSANWFQHGRAEFQTSTPANQNDGLREVIQASTQAVGASPNTSTNLTLLTAVPFPIVLGHAVRLIPGCDLLPQTCKTKFGRYSRFRGGRHIEGADKALKTADAV